MHVKTTSIRKNIMVIASSLLAFAFVGACGGSQQSAGASASAGSDTPVPADRQCNFVNFHHDEARNGQGAGACASDCDCDGMRSCVAGKCQGTARPAASTATACNSKEYHYNESWSASGAGKCSGDCECDGMRTCTSGSCSGTAR